MKRRKFTQIVGIGSIGLPMTKFSPIKNRGNAFYNSSEVIVVGAGTFGVWTAYHLNQMGAKVTLLDAYGPGNSRASSGGETRLIQADNDNSIYVESAIRSYHWWSKMMEMTGEELVLSTGRLTMSKNEGSRLYAQKRKEQLSSHGIDNTEVLDQDEIRYRWPQIHTDDLAGAMYNDGGPSGSTLMARKGIKAVAKEFVKNGGSIVIAKGQPIINYGKIVGINVGNETLKAQCYVFACGPWLPKVFPDLLLPKTKVERRDVLFVGTPSGNDQYSHPNLPEWSVTGSGYYGFPDIEGRGLKVAPYPDYNTFDPDRDERLINHYQVKRAHDFVGHRFPGLKGQPIIESRVCQVTNSVDGNFIVDQHPSSDNAWIVGAGSGHGFKHGPAIGEYTAKRVFDEQVNKEYDSLFKLKKENFKVE